MTRTFWVGRAVCGLLALLPATGCTQQLWMEPADYHGALESGVLAKLEYSPHEAIAPPVVEPGSAPATILDPDREPRYVSLKECIAIALEQGNIGFPVTTNPGLLQDQLPSFTGRGTTGTDTIRAFALDPAIAQAEIERSLSKFDARWLTSMTWQKQEQAFPVEFQALLNNADRAQLTTTLAKPLPTGGTTGITFSTDYINLSQPPPPGSPFAALPTSYTPRLQFLFEQPLLQGFGVEVNQMLGIHPGSQLIPGLRPSGGQGSEGILVTRIRMDQQKAEFDRQVNSMLFNVESAYWNLFSAYYNLYAQEEGLKQSYDAYLIIKNRAQGGVARPQSAEQYAAQVASFRAAVLQARGQVLSAERNLRGMLGMRSDDGTRLVPADDPTLVPYRPDYYQEANEAIQYRPELMIARQELKAQQLNLLLQRNLRRPDLRFVSSYEMQGIGARLDGPRGVNAMANFMENNFNSWQLGFRLDMPIGFRDANALVRQAQLSMRKAYFTLIDSERKTMEYLTVQYRQVIEAHEVIKYRRAQREALEVFVGKNLQVLNTGAVGQAEFEGFIGNLLQAQQNLANATAQEVQAVAQYNAALAGLEFAKGTIQRYNNVTISEGPLPPWVEKKAADHFNARDAAIKLREHPTNIGFPRLTDWQPISDMPQIPDGKVAPGIPLITDPVMRDGPSPVPYPPAKSPLESGGDAKPSYLEPNPLGPISDPPAGTELEFPQTGTVTLPKWNPPSATPAITPTRDPVPAVTVPGFPASNPGTDPPPLPNVAEPPTAPLLTSPIK